LKKTSKYILCALVAAFVLGFVVATPYVMAEMGATGSHMGKYNIQEKLDAYCDMSPEEQAEVIAKHNKSEDKVAKMNEYCLLDEEGRTALIESYKADYQHHDKKKHGDVNKMIDAYCDMSPEEQAEVIAKHNKSDEMVSKINEYCSLDEEGRKAMIAKYKEKFKRHPDADKHGMTGMVDNNKVLEPTGNEDSNARHAEFVEKIQELKQAHANGDFDKVKKLAAELQDLRNQIVEEIRH